MDNNFANKFSEQRALALEKYFGGINPAQRSAVFKTKGPVLILAGAGSGKTTVIVQRISNMIAFGDGHDSDFVPQSMNEGDLAYLENYIATGDFELERLRSICAVNPIAPYRILAITFTNKAANELKARLSEAVGPEAVDINASTFHSTCVRILRREIEALGYGANFTIYDSDDSMRVIKDIAKAQKLDEKNFTPRSVLSGISRAKDSLLTPAQYAATAAGNYRVEVISKIYEDYQKQLKAANAVDFDDIIVLTVNLFERFPEILEKYRKRYAYVMVDEYQDTNHAQYKLVSLLAAEHRNICVVGDDDQSIYKFRGANIENILSFEKQFEGSMVIRLEQNYRCTKKILDAANHVIENNTQRKGKTLWTDNGDGEEVFVYRAQDEAGESLYIAQTIMDNVAAGAKFADHAILYRMNAQSNAIEKALVRSSVPYRVVSGVKFYERKEIKDVLAYMSIINNNNDTVRLMRIINEPKRGIGEATVTQCREISEAMNLPMLEIMLTANDYTPLARKSRALGEFAKLMRLLEESSETEGLAELFDIVLEKSGYLAMLNAQLPESQTRIENVQELKSNIIAYETENPEGGLSGFLEEVALYTDMDSYDTAADAVVMMTLHSAKGLEYPYVFIAGMEEGIFPGVQAMYSPEEVEEERRLAYVGITRAKTRLYITNAAQRMLFGKTARNRISRFVGEIPTELTQVTDDTAKTYRSKVVSAAFDAEGELRAKNARGFGNAPVRVSNETYSGGDKVSHKVFGDGIVISVTPMGNDNLLEIAFDTVGTKKIMSNFAKLLKI